MQPTIEEKEAVLKMAGVLIRTEKNLWIAQPTTLQPLTIAHTRDRCVEKAFNRYILKSKS